MATIFSNWTSTKSDGTINEKLLPARVFQMKLTSYIWAYFSNEAAGNAAALVGSLGGVAVPVMGITSKTITQDFKFQIVRGASVVFEAHVTIKIFMVALVVDAGWGTMMALYTWNMVDGQSSCVVSIPVPPPATLGTTQINADPASGFGNTNAVAEIVYDIVAPAFQFNLQPGDKIKIPFAAAGPPYVVKSAAVQIRTILGGQAIDTLRDARIGASWFLYSADDQLRCAMTVRRGGKTVEETDSLVRDTVAAGQVLYGKLFRHGATLYALAHDSLTRLFISLDDSATWAPIAAMQTNIATLAAAHDKRGGLIYVYGKGQGNSAAQGEGIGAIVNNAPSFTVLGKSKDGEWRMVRRGSATLSGTGEALPTEDLAGMEFIDGLLRLTAKETALFQVWESTDGGATWRYRPE
jgi:hypothetical protein